MQESALKQTPAARLEKTGIAYGNTPLTIADEPVRLSRRQIEEVETAAAAVGKLLSVVRRELVSGGPIGRELSLLCQGDILRSALSRVPEKEEELSLFRPDFFWDERGRLTMVEAETFVGGLGMASAITFAYGDGAFVPGIVSALAETIKAKVGSGRQILAVVVNPASKAAYDREFAVLGEFLRPYGITLRVARPDEIRLIGENVRHAGEKVDFLHRFFRLEELKREYNPTVVKTFVRIWREQLLPQLQPWCELLEEKVIMALLWRPDLVSHWRQALGRETFRLLRRLIPPTRVVRPDDDYVE